jgi:4'-phosphopantetheinyl transferase
MMGSPNRAPASLALRPDEVHVWWIPLDLSAPRLDALDGILSPDERARADRFHFRRDRDRFVVGRASLREILGGYLERDPVSLAFSQGPWGKPALSLRSESEDLDFNLAHSDGLGALAVSRGRALGVDVEAVRRDFELEEIAERFFSSSEVAVFRGLPPGQRAEAFFACWTRKEAYIKARGEGLSIPLDKFSVAFAPGETPALLECELDSNEVRRWCFEDLRPGPGFAGALAVEGTGWRLHCSEWR